MGITIENKVDFINLKSKIDKQIGQRFGQLMSDAKANILKRTANGTDYNGRPFDKYSPDYEKYRREVLKRQTSVVDLRVSGIMLGSMYVEISKENDKFVGAIKITNPTAFARAQGNIDKGRDFFGIPEEEKNKIVSELLGAINL